MKILICLILASLPSIIWLAFYLRKDRHPEPNRLVIKIFLWGAIVVILAGLLEFLISYIPRIFVINAVLFIIVSFAFVEEILKYLVVKLGILKNPEFDEPVDAMIYMIIAALGFAAAENIYLLSQIHPLQNSLKVTLEFITTRFLGATFLHALASAIAGYFLAASLLITSKIRKFLIGGGILAATILHSIFNYLIILNGQQLISDVARNFYLIIILGSMAIMVSFMFKKINKYRSICKI